MICLLVGSDPDDSLLLRVGGDQDFVLKHLLCLPVQVGGHLHPVPLGVDQGRNKDLCGRDYLQVGKEGELHHSAVRIIREGEWCTSRCLGVGLGEDPIREENYHEAQSADIYVLVDLRVEVTLTLPESSPLPTRPCPSMTSADVSLNPHSSLLTPHLLRYSSPSGTLEKPGPRLPRLNRSAIPLKTLENSALCLV